MPQRNSTGDHGRNRKPLTLEVTATEEMPAAQFDAWLDTYVRGVLKLEGIEVPLRAPPVPPVAK